MRLIPWQKKAQRAATPSDEVAAECGAFLQGRFAQLLEARHRTVPPWAWLNQVAHGDPELLQELAGQSHPARQLGQPAWEWPQAMADLAAELFWLVGDDPTALHQLQLEALIPLELELMGHGPQWAIGPSRLLGDAKAALLRAIPRVAPDGPRGARRAPHPMDPGEEPGSPR